jgi:DNA-binding Lrp family transcriptional regulator
MLALYHWKQRSRRHYRVEINKFIGQNTGGSKEMAESKRFEYPEMKSGLTVFILMCLQTSKEIKLIEKLYALDEVKEIYSVHGDVDLLVKVELIRDLLSSDAEVVSQFVHERVRQLPGIISTNTLIPGFSRIKAPPID